MLKVNHSRTIMFLKKFFFVLGLIICSLIFTSSSFSQENDSLIYKLEHFDSLEWKEKTKVAIAYSETDLNYNVVNIYILWYYEFLSLYDIENYKIIFNKTSFPNEELQEDSLFFSLKINLYDDDSLKAESTYELMKAKSNKNRNLAGQQLSDYYYYSNPQKSLKYLEEVFNFNIDDYLNTKRKIWRYNSIVDNYFRLLYSNRKHKTIIGFCDSILIYKPNNEIWMERKAKSQFALNQFKEASQTYHKLYDLTNKMQHLQSLMYTYTNVNDTVSALHTLRKNIELRGKKDIESRHFFLEYLDLFKIDKLKDSLVREVLKKEPEYYISNIPSEGFYYYSIFQAENQQINEGIETLFLAIEMVDTTNSVYQSNSYPPSFHSVYDYYITNEDGTLLKSKYYNRIAWYYTFLGKKRKSLIAHRKALEFYGCNPNSNYRLAYLHKSKFWRSNNKAIPFYENIISCNTIGWSSYYAINQLSRHYYYKEGNAKKAKELLLSIFSYGELQSTDYVLLSQIYEEEGNYFEAIKMIDQAIALENEEGYREYCKDIKVRLEFSQKLKN